MSSKQSLLFTYLGIFSITTAYGHNPNQSLISSPDSIHGVTLKYVDVVARINHLNEVSKVDLAVNPVKSSQEVLRAVPGLFIAQHAGGSKAEQMFLRGFDLAHGTDICSLQYKRPYA